MFRSATTRIAHNSHVAGLAQVALSKDLKALQDLINAEKAMQQTLQRLSIDTAKASEAVKLWGNGEGDDLGDTLAACNALLLHFAAAATRFYNHEATIREQMKAVRTREENLDELKKRRKSLASKADTADKRLNKMSAESKNFQAQADTLNKLREEIRMLDTEILNEEASLGDFKRTSAKNWMGLKFGALAEFCERGLIVSDLGKLVIAEIPLFPTEPGLPRPYYTGHANTETLVTEARQRIDQVMFSTDPAPTLMNIRQIPGQELPPVIPNTGIIPRHNSSQLTFMTAPSASGTPDPSARGSQRYSQVILSPTGTNYMQLPELGGSGGFGMSSILESDKYPQPPQSPPPGSVLSSNTDPYVPTSYMHSVPQTPVSQGAEVSEFGLYPAQFAPRSSSLRNDQSSVGMPAGPRDSRFGTFPLKSAGGPRPPPSQASSSSLSGVPPRLDDRVPSVELDRAELNDSFESSIAEALGQQWTPDDPRPNSAPIGSKAYEAKMHVRNRDYSPPPPQYPGEPLAPLQEHKHSAVTQEMTDNNPFRGERTSRGDLEEEAELAYMSPQHEERNSLPSTSGHGHEDRRVRFGGEETIDEAIDEVTPQPSRQVTTDDANAPSPPAAYQSAPQIPPVSSPPHSPALPPPPEPSGILPVSFQGVPPQNQTTPEEEEKALNAAAAREVSRELDALMFSSPLKPADPAPPTPSRVDPMQVPQPPFVRRSNPSRSSLSIGSPTSPTGPRPDLTYVRERDRSGSAVSSPTSISHHSSINTGGSQSADGHSPQTPPVSIAIPPISSPTLSSTGSTPYRTPSEFPLQPAGPGSFYKMPVMSGSAGSFTAGGARTISAAAFKRQIRNPSSPPLDSSSPLPDGTSPLMVKKRLPGSPYPASRLQADSPGFPGMQRVSSAPDPAYQRGDPEGRNRSSSGTYASQQSGDGPPARPSGEYEHGEEDHYDYISAYVDEPPDSAQSAHGQGYGSGRYNEGGFR